VGTGVGLGVHAALRTRAMHFEQRRMPFMPHRGYSHHIAALGPSSHARWARPSTCLELRASFTRCGLDVLRPNVGSNA